MTLAVREKEENLAASFASRRSIWFNSNALGITPLHNWYPWPTVMGPGDKTALVHVVNLLSPADKTALMHVENVFTLDKTALMQVRGTGVTSDKTALLLINGKVAGLGTGFRVWFLYPFAAPTLELGLRRPEPQNAEPHNLRVIARETRGGTDQRFTRGGRRRGLELQFRFMTATMKSDLATFFNTVKDQAFRYIDHQEKTWKAWRQPGRLNLSENAPDETWNLTLSLRVEDV